MIKGLGISNRIAPILVPETQENVAEQNTEVQNTPAAQPKVVGTSNTLMKSESALSGAAMQAYLNNQLMQQSSMKGEAAHQINNLLYVKPPTKENVSDPKTLFIGDGNDDVRIRYGDDGLVHVGVRERSVEGGYMNYSEVWSGTKEQFQALKIDTGAGNDFVSNFVDGANIATGDGNDVVANEGFNTSIDTGAGNDAVNNNVDGAKIVTGDGDDRVFNKGSNSLIDTGAGNDEVDWKGNQNQINTGSGDDRIQSSGDFNTINSGDGNDDVSSAGHSNAIDGGSGDDFIHSQGHSNRVDGGGGDDWLSVYGDSNIVNGGSGNDEILSAGWGSNQSNILFTGSGDDKVSKGPLDIVGEGEPLGLNSTMSVARDEKN